MCQTSLKMSVDSLTGVTEPETELLQSLSNHEKCQVYTRRQVTAVIGCHSCLWGFQSDYFVTILH